MAAPTNRITEFFKNEAARKQREDAAAAQATKATAEKRKSPSVRVGNLTITEWPDGKLWLAHKNGEGMQTSAEKLGAVLEEYFQKEF